MSINDTSTPSDTSPMHNPEPQRSSATRPIMILLAVIGGVTLLAFIVTSGISSALGLNRGAETMTAGTSGVTGVNVDANASRFNLEFGDVSEATLQVNGLNANSWELSRDGDELLVQAPDQWLNWCFFNCNLDDNQVTLVLPQELNNGQLNAEMELSAGQLEATGDFDRLEVDVGAGEANINGSANELDAQMSAGSANMHLADVQTADLDISAGRMIAEFTGTAPEAVNAEVSAGQLDVTLPDTAYAVDSQVSAGNLDNQLQTSSGSNHRVTVELSAGNAILRSDNNS